RRGRPDRVDAPGRAGIAVVIPVLRNSACGNRLTRLRKWHDGAVGRAEIARVARADLRSNGGAKAPSSQLWLLWRAGFRVGDGAGALEPAVRAPRGPPRFALVVRSGHRGDPSFDAGEEIASPVRRGAAAVKIREADVGRGCGAPIEPCHVCGAP